MGYSTDFTGQFDLNKPLDDDTYNFLKKLAETRRMKRHFENEAFGIDGEFYVDGAGPYGQGNEDSIIDYNQPPRTQPSLWCQWTPTDDKLHIEWDGGEKFYDYIGWIQYIIEKVLKPKGYKLSGEVEWNGEGLGDIGKIKITNNIIKIGEPVITYKYRKI